jgi:FkbM family methyltransferase
LAKFSSTPRISSIQTTIARDLRLRQQHWDVGSLLQEAVSECLYVAFEPDPATFATLRRNVYQNHLSDVELHSVAIGDHSGQIELFRDPSPESSSLRMSTLRQRHDGPSVAVQLRRLSDFIRSDIDLLKIDVEGAEDAALGDLAGSGKLRYAKRLHLEYHHHIDASIVDAAADRGERLRLSVAGDREALASRSLVSGHIDLLLPEVSAGQGPILG